MSYTYKLLPRFSDFDSYGIIHHSNYLRFVEEARFQLIRDTFGRDIDNIIGEDFRCLVVESRCRYIHLINSREPVCISMTLTLYHWIYIICDYRIYDGSSDNTYVIGMTKHCFVDKSFNLMLSFPQHFVDVCLSWLKLNSIPYIKILL